MLCVHTVHPVLQLSKLLQCHAAVSALTCAHPLLTAGRTVPQHQSARSSVLCPRREWGHQNCSPPPPSGLSDNLLPCNQLLATRSWIRAHWACTDLRPPVLYPLSSGTDDFENIGAVAPPLVERHPSNPHSQELVRPGGVRDSRDLEACPACHADRLKCMLPEARYSSENQRVGGQLHPMIAFENGQVDLVCYAFHGKTVVCFLSDDRSFIGSIIVASCGLQHSNGLQDALKTISDHCAT
ncbi:hypothetical protein J1614_010538 [Plenodomus biglobosus]|nr:hypothetical protein J1614_010538 [Plenodomus biglobosus]